MASILDILFSELQVYGIFCQKPTVYGIFCPLKYKYMGYSVRNAQYMVHSVLWITCIWDIISYEIQVCVIFCQKTIFGIFCPLKYQYMGYSVRNTQYMEYSVLWITSIWNGTFPPLKYKFMRHSLIWNTRIGKFCPPKYKHMGLLLSSEVQIYGIFCSLTDKYLSS